MNATTRNSVPTAQWRVQKQAPEARKISVAAMRHCSAGHHCTRNCMTVIP